MKDWNVKAMIIATSVVLSGIAIVFALRMMPDWLLKWIFFAIVAVFAGLVWKSLYDAYEDEK
jgi:hypothetical protein